MSANVFVDDRILLDVGFDAARYQLGRLANDGGLLSAAEYAYGAGITGLAGTARPAAGMSRLAGVQAEDIADTPYGARLWLRWDAIGPDGADYPALDAVVTLTPAGQVISSLALAGVYRLPGQVEAELSPAVAHCFATVAIRGFIARLACALMPAGAALR
jgi:hypothetical protein